MSEPHAERDGASPLTPAALARFLEEVTHQLATAASEGMPPDIPFLVALARLQRQCATAASWEEVTRLSMAAIATDDTSPAPAGSLPEDDPLYALGSPPALRDAIEQRARDPEALLAYYRALGCAAAVWDQVAICARTWPNVPMSILRGFTGDGAMVDRLAWLLEQTALHGAKADWAVGQIIQHAPEWHEDGTLRWAVVKAVADRRVGLGGALGAWRAEYYAAARALTDGPTRHWHLTRLLDFIRPDDETPSAVLLHLVECGLARAAGKVIYEHQHATLPVWAALARSGVTADAALRAFLASSACTVATPEERTPIILSLLTATMSAHGDLSHHTIRRMLDAVTPAGWVEVMIIAKLNTHARFAQYRGRIPAGLRPEHLLPLLSHDVLAVRTLGAELAAQVKDEAAADLTADVAPAAPSSAAPRRRGRSV